MTRDGHYVAFVGALKFYPVNNMLYVWNSWTASCVYTNSTLTNPAALGISPDGQRLAFLGSCAAATLTGVDWASNRVWVVNSGLLRPIVPGCDSAATIAS